MSDVPPSSDPQHHREQFCGLGAGGGAAAGHVRGRRRRQDPEPDEEAAEPRHPALLHKRGGQHHLRGGALGGPDGLRIHLDRTVSGSWRCRPHPARVSYR